MPRFCYILALSEERSWNPDETDERFAFYDAHSLLSKLDEELCRERVIDLAIASLEKGCPDKTVRQVECWQRWCDAVDPHGWPDDPSDLCKTPYNRAWARLQDDIRALPEEGFTKTWHANVCVLSCDDCTAYARCTKGKGDHDECEGKRPVPVYRDADVAQ